MHCSVNFTLFICGMNWTAFAIVVLFLALISAAYHKRRGYFFRRTFVLACMGFGGIGLLVYKLVLG